MSVGSGCWIGPGARIRGDYGAIVIGDDSSVEGKCIIHARPDEQATIGNRVTMGHGAIALLSDTDGNGRSAALAVTGSIERPVEAQAATHQEPRDQALLAQIEDMVARAGLNAVPVGERHLTSDQIAARLNITPKTVRRLCNEGQINAKKLASGEWRSTQEDLDRSPYVMNKQRNKRAQVE